MLLGPIIELLLSGAVARWREAAAHFCLAVFCGAAVGAACLCGRRLALWIQSAPTAEAPIVTFYPKNNNTARGGDYGTSKYTWPRDIGFFPP